MSNVIFTGRTHIPFPQMTWRWIDVRKYEISAAAISEKDVLTELMSLPQFADSYLAPFISLGMNDEIVHGPYLLGRLRVSDFRQTPPKEARSIVLDFIVARTPSPSVEELDIDKLILQPIAKADRIYQLESSPASRYEFAGILGDFRELVVIEPGRKSLLDIVMAED